MNKLSAALLLATSLFFIDVTPATAHPGAHVDRVAERGYRSDRGYHGGWVRRHEMPRRLRQNDGFRHWYRRSPLAEYRQISWNQLFQIYRWERRYFERRFYFAFDDDRRRDRDRRRRRGDD